MPDTNTRSRKNNRPFPWRCPECGHKEVRPATVRHVSKIKHEGKLHEVKVPDLRVLKCGHCGECLFGNEADEQIARALRSQLGLMQPEEIREQRRRLELTQARLGTHLGVATETISRWESGAMIQSRAMDRYLRLYLRLPEVRAALAGPGAESGGTESESGEAGAVLILLRRLDADRRGQPSAAGYVRALLDHVDSVPDHGRQIRLLELMVSMAREWAPAPTRTKDTTNPSPSHTAPLSNGEGAARLL